MSAGLVDWLSHHITRRGIVADNVESILPDTSSHIHSRALSIGTSHHVTSSSCQLCPVTADFARLAGTGAEVPIVSLVVPSF